MRSHSAVLGVRSHVYRFYSLDSTPGPEEVFEFGVTGGSA